MNVKAGDHMPACPNLNFLFLEDNSYWYFKNTSDKIQEEVTNWIEKEHGMDLSWMQSTKIIFEESKSASELEHPQNETQLLVRFDKLS